MSESLTRGKEAGTSYRERRRLTMAATTSSAPVPSKAGATAIGAAPVDGVEGVAEVVAVVQIPVGGLITLLSSVSAPFRASARPPFRPPPTPIVAPVVRVMLVSAIRFP